MSNHPPKLLRNWRLAMLAVGVSLVMVVLFLRQIAKHSRAGKSNLPKTGGADAGKPAASRRSAASEPRIISSVVSALHQGVGPEGARAALVKLRAELSALTPQAAAGLIVQTLDSQVDATTAQDLVVGPDGALKSSSSLRVFLLDYLARVDPMMAAAYAERVLKSFSTADEWAVSLRNYARVNNSAQGRAFLEQKFDAMVRNKGWQKDPSEGFLESFDVAVFIGGTGLLPVLSELVRAQDNRAVSHAAYLALDRLVIGQPAETLRELQRQPELLEGREPTRANYFARADVTDAAQRTVLESYVLDIRRTPVELQTFAGLFPNANFMISQNLLTHVTTPDRASLTARDAAALRVVQEWLADPRFAGRRSQLEAIQRRLEGFIRQAEGTR